MRPVGFFCIGENWISSIIKKQKDETTRESFLKTFSVSRCFSLARSFGERVTEGPLSLSLSLSTHIFTRTVEWTRENEEKEDVAQWEDDWDDTEADDFKTHLREELKKNVASRQRQQK